MPLTEDTQIITKTETISNSTQAQKDHSHIFNVSLRGWITLIIVTTVCVMSVRLIEVKEPLYTLVGMVIGYYFAQNKQETGSKAVVGK